jgi:rhodanese-related sulfurtransferase
MKLKSIAIAVYAAILASAPILGITTSVWAADVSAVQPKEDWYKHIVEYDDVKLHADLPKDDKAALLIDSRPAARRYDTGHIPTAINIPETQFDKLTGKLPVDKAAPLIFYCQGFECILSHKSAFKAEALGYTNIKVYAAGFPDWEAKGALVAVSLAHIRKLMDDKADFVLVDSRPERTFEKGAIPGAINISDSKFDKLAPGMLPADKTKTLIFYCGGFKCDLSSKSATKAKSLGYKNVFIFPEGYPAWQAAMGGPTPDTAGPAAQATPAAAPQIATIAIEPGKEKGSISVQSFERILKDNPSQVTIIDVRDEKDVKKGTFPGALNIPVGDIEKKLAELPKDKPIIFTCSTGARSGEAHDTVKMLGGKDLTTYFLDADVSFDGSKYTIKPH